MLTRLIRIHIKIDVEKYGMKFRYLRSVEHGTEDMINSRISIILELRNSKQPVSLVPGIRNCKITSEQV